MERRPRTLLLRAAALLPLLALPGPARAEDPVLAAAGDIACAPESPYFNGGLGTDTACRMRATSDLLLALSPDVVLPLGDTQYEDGSKARFDLSYGPTWGRLFGRTRPVVGNHEYGTAGAAGYFAYFGSAAGDPATGSYAFDLGAWRVIVLNSNCAVGGGCAAGSPQETWLREELAAHPGVCTLAAMHHPRFSSGAHGSDPSLSPFWEALYSAGADVVLAAHDHDYERFGRQRPDGTPDAFHGLRSFVVGTGGKDTRPFPAVAPNSRVRVTGTFGVLALTLRASSYDWAFHATDGSILDSGSGTCHRAPRPRRLHPLSPCRLVDTRLADGPLGGPALPAGSPRTFPLRGACGVPESAEVLVLNVTAVTPTAAGTLRAAPSGPAASSADVVAFRAGATRAAQLLGWLGNDGGLVVTADLPSGSAHVVIDVSGYFE